MIKKEQLKKIRTKSREKKKEKWNKILRDEIKRKNKTSQVNKKKINSQENEYNIWYINKTKSNGNRWKKSKIKKDQ